jgi:hypothetical protein
MAFVDDISVPYEMDFYQVHLVPDIDYITVAVGDTDPATENLPNPAIAVLDPNAMSLLASSDGDGGFISTGTFFRVPVEGEYVLAVHDQTGGTGFYDASITALGEQEDVPGDLIGEVVGGPPAPEPTGLAGLPDPGFTPGFA